MTTPLPSRPRFSTRPRVEGEFPLALARFCARMARTRERRWSYLHSCFFGTLEVAER